MVCNFLAEKQITYLFPMTVFVIFCLSFCPLIYTVNIWVSSFIVMLIVFGASLKKNEMLCQHCTVKLNFMCFKQVWIVISLNEEETFGVDCSCAVWHISLVPVVIVSTYCIHISKYTVGLFVDNRYIIQQWHHISSWWTNIMWSVRLSFGTLTLLVGLQEGHLACKNHWLIELRDMSLEVLHSVWLWQLEKVTILVADFNPIQQMPLWYWVHFICHIWIEKYHIFYLWFCVCIMQVNYNICKLSETC